MAPKNVLVTGASTGIGEACALHLDRLGWRVFAGVRRDEDGARLKAQAPTGSQLTPVRIDVTDETQVVAALETIRTAVGAEGLSGLVNNAGVARGGPIEFLPLDEWRDQFEVNIIGQIAVTKAALALIRPVKGRVVFIGSISGRVSPPMVAPYSASKHAIEALGAALREELLPWGIKVAVVEPGVIKTPIWAKGRDRVDEFEQLFGADALELYRSHIDTIRASIDKSERRGVPAAKVADAVEHALTSDRPRHRYLVGPDAKLAGNLARVVPDRLWARLSRRLLSL